MVVFDELLLFFKSCLRLSTFPDCYKIGTLRLIAKPVQLDTYKKYRLIILVSIQAKTLERLIATPPASASFDSERVCSLWTHF